MTDVEPLFSPAPPRPARTTITGCLIDAIRFELDVVAYAPRPVSRPATTPPAAPPGP